MLNVGLRRRPWRILADDEGDGAMSVDVVGTVLSIVFENEDRGVIPVRAVRHGVDHAAESQVIVSYVRGWTGTVGTRASGMVIGQVEQHEGWQLVILAFMRLAGVNVSREFVQ